MPQGAIPLGSYLYLFLAPENDTDCLISAHGGYSKNVRPMTVPGGVRLVFYHPHNYLLNDPGLDLMTKTKGAVIHEVWTEDTPATETFDYTLSKYQDSEKKGIFRSIARKADSDFGKHNKAGENYSKIVMEIARADQQIRRWQQTLDSDTAMDFQKTNATANLNAYSGAMNVLTVRNRFKKSDISLSYAVAAVIERKPTIKNFYCSFCRGLDTEDNTPSYTVDHRVI